jgi:DNA-binding transcriptional regulator YhcF (GntR family)
VIRQSIIRESLATRADEVARTLRSRILMGLHTDTLRVGDRLPGVRDIATELGADRRTVLRACRTLEHEGILDLRRRSGMYITLSSSAPVVLGPREQVIVRLFSEGMEHGIAAVDIPRILAEYLARADVRIACVGSSRAHAGALCAVVHAEFGITAYPLGLEDLERESPFAGSPTTVGIVTTAFHAALAGRAAGEEGPPVFLAVLTPVDSTCPALTVETEAYVIGPDAAWARLARESLRVTSGSDNLHFLVAGVDDLTAIPPEARILVTPAAEIQLRGAELARRAERLRYTLPSYEAARLLRTIVGATPADPAPIRNLGLPEV